MLKHATQAVLCELKGLVAIRVTAPEDIRHLSSPSGCVSTATRDGHVRATEQVDKEDDIPRARSVPTSRRQFGLNKTLFETTERCKESLCAHQQAIAIAYRQ